MSETKENTLRSITPQAVSLSDQWTKLETIERELRDRIRRDRNTILAEHDRLWVSIQSDYTQRISEEVARLEKMREADLHELTVKTAEQLREHEMLAKRMNTLS
jgi:hypothetical protein